MVNAVVVAFQALWAGRVALAVLVGAFPPTALPLEREQGLVGVRAIALVHGAMATSAIFARAVCRADPCWKGMVSCLLRLTCSKIPALRTSEPIEG